LLPFRIDALNNYLSSREINIVPSKRMGLAQSAAGTEIEAHNWFEPRSKELFKSLFYFVDTQISRKFGLWDANRSNTIKRIINN
jgi:hypothetical protein